ncbi:response regulator transcription factor [Candidatus Poribacteria bacterium]|nr:response regulator transcription factor [Candidatus Poribacteria bacterium]
MRNDKTYKILIADDEEDIVDIIKIYLESEGYEVITASDGFETLKKAEYESPHLIILDIMMPKLDGFEVCRRIRAEMSTPILILTARRTEDVDKVIGLELGADDYMIKPFDSRELVARVKALLRRTYREDYQVRSPTETIKFKDLIIDIQRRQVNIRGKSLQLTVKEFDLLFFLASHPGRVYSRDQLLDEVWGRDFVVGPRTVDVHIRRLREQIEANAAEPEYIQTVWGIGYKFAEE